VGKGSTFTFSIKVESIPSVREDIEARILSLARGKSVLVFDDNPTFQRVLTKTLQRVGMVVHIAATPKAVIAQLQNVVPPTTC